MTREQAKKKLIDLGVAEPTEEQVTKYLDGVSAETKSEKEKAEKLKAENDRLKEVAGKAEELQGKIDEIEQGKLSEVEKITKEYEKANSRIAELERNIAIRDQKATIAEKFKVTAEQVNQIVKEDGSLDYDILGQIISEKESAAALAKEQEIANAAANPNGTNGSGGDGNEKSSAVKLVEKHFNKQAANTDIISQYANGGK